jgi:hypothetical protein
MATDDTGGPLQTDIGTTRDIKAPLPRLVALTDAELAVPAHVLTMQLS